MNQKKRENVFGMLGYIFSWLSILTCWVPYFNLLYIMFIAPFLVLGYRFQKNTKRVFLAVGTVVLSVSLIVSVVVTTNGVKNDLAKWQQRELIRAHTACCQDEAVYAFMNDDGTLLVLDSNPNNEEGYQEQATLDAMAAVNEQLKLPPELTQAMLQQQTQTQSHQREHLSVSWTHNPAYGLEVMYRLDLPAAE